MRIEEGKLYPFVPIDAESKFACLESYPEPTRRIAVEYLRHLAAALPYKIHVLPPDNGTHFTNPTGGVGALEHNK